VLGVPWPWDRSGSQALATLCNAGIAVRRINTHDKFILLKGRYAGSPATRRIVFTGSHNLSHSANYLNDELFVKLEDDTTYASVRYSWERMTEDEDVTRIRNGYGRRTPTRHRRHCAAEQPPPPALPRQTAPGEGRTSSRGDVVHCARTHCCTHGRMRGSQRGTCARYSR
jgi:phosphatidylserine/phosphatidylglycerophosphate/cardiolipin synthase-like enzyme